MAIVTVVLQAEVEMLTVSKGALKTRMLEYFRRVQETGEEIVVTDNRVPVLKVVPIKRKLRADEVFADVRSRVRYLENIMEPTTDEWESTLT